MYVCMYVCIYIYIYIYMKRERERLDWEDMLVQTLQLIMKMGGQREIFTMSESQLGQNNECVVIDFWCSQRSPVQDDTIRRCTIQQMSVGYDAVRQCKVRQGTVR